MNRLDKTDPTDIRKPTDITNSTDIPGPTIRRTSLYNESPV